MKQQWDYETDYLVVGTGAAGLSAAITAKRNGLDTIVIESTDKWGGTTAISGGGLWMPNNPLMRRDRAGDSFEEALEYMKQTIGNVGPWTSEARMRAFLMGVDHYVNMMRDEGVRWTRAKAYPDYYPDLPGGRVGRGIESKPYNRRRLPKQWRDTQRISIPAPLLTSDMYLLTRAWSTPSGFLHGARFVLRMLGGFATGQLQGGIGVALTGAYMEIVLRHKTPVWLNAPLEDLVIEKGVVVGACVKKDGKTVRIRTTKGVMLGAGGFAANKEWRKKYHGVAGWTSAPEGQLGQGISIGEKAGGTLGMMDDAWWGGTAANTNGSETMHGFILNERSDPWSIVVDQTGRRYMNESESYVDFGHHMLERNKTTPAVPSWIIYDRRHTKSFLNSTLMVPGAKKKLAEMGELVQAATIEELGKNMGVDPAVFAETIERFNEFAREGVDKDFGRGRTEYDRYYGSPAAKPNPNLGTIEKGPFIAHKIYPGDLGTKGGLVTDEWARVLRKDGSVIVGLYAAGNNTASVMGHTYPGPGSTIGPAGVFGYLGALHASQRTRPLDTINEVASAK